MKLGVYLESMSVAERFGDILFGSVRNLPEKDTQYERKVYNRIDQWVAGDFMDGSSQADVVHIMQELRELKNEFPDVLKPDATLLYRGVNSDRIKSLGLKKEDFKQKGEFMVSKRSVVYKPRSFIQSWTTSAMKAYDFVDMIRASYAVIYKVQFKEDDLLFNSKFLDVVGNMDQDEIIHIGNDPINAVVMIYKNDFDKIFEMHFK